MSIDPAVSVSETSDATGIVVCGLGDDGQGYLIDDLSGKYSPTEWATKAIAAYKRHKADRIVAEANQGAPWSRLHCALLIGLYRCGWFMRREARSLGLNL